MNKLILSLALVLGFVASSQAQITGVTIYDPSVAFFNGSTRISTGVYEVRFGTYSGEVFTPYFGAPAGTSNDGYIGDPFGDFEFSVYLTTPDNTVVAAGSQLYVAITLIADNENYVSSDNEVILTDPSWLTPVLALSGNQVDFAFSQNTTAVKGSFAFNGGNEIITIVGSAIPEPSSFAALAGLGILGVVATRRRRSA